MHGKGVWLEVPWETLLAPALAQVIKHIPSYTPVDFCDGAVVDILGAAILSFIERLSSSLRLRMY